jgi:hypothetical protein
MDFSMPSGLKLPDFSRNNQFSGSPFSMGQGSQNGNPFSLTPGAAQAASMLQPMMGGMGGGGGLGNAGNALTSAANKLSSAADKISSAADKLASITGGAPGAPGAPVSPGIPRRPNMPGSPNQPGGPGVFSGMAAFSALNTVGRGIADYSMAGFNRQFAEQSYFEQQRGVGQFFRQQAAQERSTKYGLGGAVAGGLLFAGAMALTPFTGGASLFAAASVGAGLGSYFGANEGRKSGLTDPQEIYKDELTAFRNFEVRRAGATGLGGLIQSGIGRLDETQNADRVRFGRAAAAISLNQQFTDAAASRESANLQLSSLRGGGISARNQTGLGTYMSGLGLTRTGAAGLESSIISASGVRGNLNDVNSVVAMMQSGIAPGVIGSVRGGFREGGGLRGLGLGSNTILEQANALGLTGAGASEYASTSLGFYRGALESGFSPNESFRRGTEAFISSGRNMGLESFQGTMGFARAQEMRGVGQGAARSFGKAIGGGGLFNELMMSSALQETGGNTFEAYKLMYSADASTQRRLMGQFGVETARMAGMEAGLSPDAISAMTGDATGGPLGTKEFGDAVKARGGAQAAKASLEDIMVNKFSSKIAAAFNAEFAKFADTVTGGATQKDIKDAIENTMSQKSPTPPVQATPAPPTNPKQQARDRARATRPRTSSGQSYGVNR